MSGCLTNVGTFEHLEEQLQNVILAFLANENICKLLYYNNKEALSEPTVVDPYNLLYTKIYTQTFIPPVDTESTYITVFFDSFDAVDGNPYLKKGRLFVNICTHRDLWNVDGGQRVVKIMNEIDKILNKNRVTSNITRDFFRKSQYRPISELFNSYDVWYTNIGSQ